MKIYNFEQGTPEWLEVRLGKLTASNAQAIQAKGAGLKTYIFDKVAEILSGKMEETYINANMERGNEHEDLARSSYEMQTGNSVEQVGFVEMDDNVGASPDGFVGEDGLIEIKCPKAGKYARFLYDKKIEPKYEWQMQMQMLVTNRKWVDYVLFHENFSDVIVHRVMRDEDKIEKIVSGLEVGLLNMGEILKEVK